MKKMKRLASLVIALAMVMTMMVGMGVTAFADTSNYTITIENSVKESTYSAYKVFDATSDGDKAVSYTIKSTDNWYGLVSGDDSPFTLTETTVSDTYNVSIKSDKTPNDVAAWFNAITKSQLSDAGITLAASEKATGSGVVLDVGESGYYYITTATGTIVTLTTAAPTATANDKNSTPGEVKKSVSDTTASIGDEVTYTITASVAKYSGDTEITNFTFTDELSAGLTAPVANEITVEIQDADGKVWTYLSNEDEGVSISVDKSSNKITISFNPTLLKKADSSESSDGTYPTFATIYISYTATVDADAVYANDNKVTETWTGGGTGATDTETVYTYGFNLWKVIKDTDTLLGGAEFTLTKKENGTTTTPIGFIRSVETVDGEEKVTYTVSTDTSDSNYTEIITVGSALIRGLAAGTYTLTETNAPEGYNLLENTVEVTVGSEGSYNTSTGINTDTTIVENSAGTSLPGTGGIGTTIFYIIGGVLVAGAVVLLITRRRMRRI